MRGKPSAVVGPLLILSLIILFVGRVEAGPLYVGAWSRTAKYINGALNTTLPATLVLTETIYSSINPAPPEEACAFTGSMEVNGGLMKVTVQVSACPAAVAVGSEKVYNYVVSNGGRTLTTTTNTEEGAVKQVYEKKNEGISLGQACSHSLCGIWNRKATYVSGEFVHNTPAYTVITEKTYYSIAPACYNALDINSFQGNTFTMTMTSLNCPTPTGVMAPGTVVVQTFALTDEGDTLTISNTEYGAEVKTVFQRLK